MQVKLTTEADENAMRVLVSRPLGSLTTLIAFFASLQCSDDEDFEIIIAKSLVAPSHRHNPSTLGKQILVKLTAFEDSSGYGTPSAPACITICLHRKRKQFRRARTQATIKTIIKDWLDLNLPAQEVLKVPLELIPPFFQTHPAHLTYQIKCEIGAPIRILKFKTFWKILRK